MKEDGGANKVDVIEEEGQHNDGSSRDDFDIYH